MALDLVDRAHASRQVWLEIGGIMLVAFAQVAVNNRMSAEHNIKMVFAMYINLGGLTSPQVIHAMRISETFYRRWGREGEADEIKCRILILTPEFTLVEHASQASQTV